MKSHNDRSRDSDSIHSTTIAMSGAGGEVAGVIAGAAVSMDGEGATPPGAKDEDGVEAERVATVGEGVDFAEEAAGVNLVGEVASLAPRFRR